MLLFGWKHFFKRQNTPIVSFRVQTVLEKTFFSIVGENLNYSLRVNEEEANPRRRRTRARSPAGFDGHRKHGSDIYKGETGVPEKSWARSSGSNPGPVPVHLVSGGRLGTAFGGAVLLSGSCGWLPGFINL